MGYIIIEKFDLSANAGVNQILTVKYRLNTDPDVPGSYTTVSTQVVAMSNGYLLTPLVISGLPDFQSILVRANNNCGGSPATQIYNLV